MSSYHILRDPYLESAEVKLADKELWEKFSRHGTEMVITKSGRNMFPHFNYKVKGLDRDALYTVILDFDLALPSRFKYTEAAGWQPAGNEETQHTQRYLIHPESPQTGAQWEKNGINFRSLKVTNTQHAPHGQIVLSSMHKYQPRLAIIQNSHAPGCTPASRHFVLKETQFIAVTAYQNSEITNLKISYNKFAKGFRDEGKANTKRKRDIGLGSPSDVPAKKHKANLLSPNSDGLRSPRSSPSSSRSQSPDDPGVCKSPEVQGQIYPPLHYSTFSPYARQYLDCCYYFNVPMISTLLPTYSQGMMVRRPTNVIPAHQHNLVIAPPNTDFTIERILSM